MIGVTIPDLAAHVGVECAFAARSFVVGGGVKGHGPVHQDRHHTVEQG